MKGIDEVIKSFTDYLNSAIFSKEISFHRSFEYRKENIPMEDSKAFVGIDKAEFYDTETILGKKLELTTRIDIFSPKEKGGGNIRAIFDEIAKALFKSNYNIKKISSGEIKYDSKMRALKMETKVKTEFYVHLDKPPMENFAGYEIRSEYNI